MKNQDQLETFWTKFRIGRPVVYDDFIVYKTARGFAVKASEDANKLIEQLGLDLTAIPTRFLANDTFVVQSNEIGYI